MRYAKCNTLEEDQYHMTSLICRFIKKKKLAHRTDWWLSEAGGEGVGEESKGTNLQIQSKHQGNVMCSTVITVNSTVLYMRKLLRVDLRSSHHQKKRIQNCV